jgi:hypothetical protein
VTLVPVLPRPFEPRPRRDDSLFGRVRRWGVMALGGLLVLLGILIAPLPGPLGVPVSLLGLVLILRNSYWAKRQFIRAQYARPKWIYPFRRSRSSRRSSGNRHCGPRRWCCVAAAAAGWSARVKASGAICANCSADRLAGALSHSRSTVM